MTRQVQCLKLGKSAEGLDRAPYPGDLGQKIFDNISKEAWDAWISQQTILINEYRLDLSDPKAREFLASEMQKFLFEPEQT